jgi:hypothetical protein
MLYQLLEGIARTLSAFGDGQENAGNERLAVVWFLENDDLLSQARTNVAKPNVSNTISILIKVARGLAGQQL